jgi:hypothetical protein
MLAVFDTLSTSMLLPSRGATPVTVISSIDVPEVGRGGGGTVDTGTACAHASTAHKMPDTTSEAMEGRSGIVTPLRIIGPLSALSTVTPIVS